MEKSRKAMRILCFGDSLTEGAYLDLIDLFIIIINFSYTTLS